MRMRIGIPKGLLFPDFGGLFESFFLELGQDIAVSPDTNRRVLDLGVGCCVDEACLPFKVFHGHVCWLRDNGDCDMIVIPRFMHLRENESICPKFCGLPEMVKYSVPGLPPIIGVPIDWSSAQGLRAWARAVASYLGCAKSDAYSALHAAVSKHNEVAQGYAVLSEQNRQSSRRDGLDGQSRATELAAPSRLSELTGSCKPENLTVSSNREFRIALLGHPYNVQDAFLNMNVAQKLARLGAAIVTDASVSETDVNREVASLFKKPFWTLARYSYGAAKHLYRTDAVDGIVYVSSFACGIDSVVVELIRDATDGLPLLVLKVDEHTGEAGIDTRLEAFTDLLRRRKTFGSNIPAYGKYISRGESAI